MHSELGDRFALGIVANEQGHIAFDTGHIDRAINLYAEALQIFDEVGGSELFVEAIEWLAVAVAAKGESTPSLRLFGATAEARTALNLPPRLESDEGELARLLGQIERGGEVPELGAAEMTQREDVLDLVTQRTSGKDPRHATRQLRIDGQPFPDQRGP